MQVVHVRPCLMSGGKDGAKSCNNDLDLAVRLSVSGEGNSKSKYI